MQSINPTNGELLRTFKTETLESVLPKIEKAALVQKNWRNVSFSERKKLLLRVAEVLSNNKENYARMMTLEMGKSIREARAEIEKCASVCIYYAEHGESFLTDEKIDSDASRSFISYEPLGVVLAIMPWNFPFWQVLRFAAPTIMAGNAVLLKHASNVPQCALAIEDIFIEAKAPEALFQTLLIGSDLVGSVIDHQTIKAVTLTGSELAGSQVAERAGKNIKKTVLELGGSDPFIVLEDADLKKAVKVAVRSRMINCGQSCIAAKRFIVVESVVDDFLSLFKNRLSELKMGDPLNNDVDYGPMAREDLAAELEGQLQRSVEMGAEIVCGGQRTGAFFEATILSGVKKGMPAYEEELFGPVAAVIVVIDEDEAIAVANDSDFGLGGSVWIADKKRGEYIARTVETGTMFVNGLVKSDPRLPFGGIKNSGYGRELSHLGIREFTNQKTIWIVGEG